MYHSLTETHKILPLRNGIGMTLFAATFNYVKYFTYSKTDKRCLGYLHITPCAMVKKRTVFVGQTKYFVLYFIQILYTELYTNYYILAMIAGEC